VTRVQGPGRAEPGKVIVRIVGQVEDRRYNPSYEGTWIDRVGNSWRRKGKRGHVLEDRRVRSLLRRADVPLVIWRSFESVSYDDVTAKVNAASALRASTHDGDIRASEWESDDGRRLLMLEDFC
jgi:hypothetical protein